MFPLFIDSGGYKLNFTMIFVTQCLLLYLRRRNGLLDKKKNKLTCTESLMIKWSNCQPPVTQFVLLCNKPILRDQLHVWANVSILGVLRFRGWRFMKFFDDRFHFLRQFEWRHLSYFICAKIIAHLMLFVVVWASLSMVKQISQNYLVVLIIVWGS